MLGEKKERLFYLDFIRALSILSIVIFHFNVSLSSRSIGVVNIFFNAYPNGNLGAIGVSLFFIISGAALMYTYQNRLSVKEYVKKRFISIYPMFWTAYSIVFLYYFYKYFTINPFVPQAEKWTIILSIIGMDGYFGYLAPHNYYLIGEWFIGCIVLFYLIFPILKNAVIKFPLLLAIISIAVYILLVQHYVFKMGIQYNMFTRLPDFLLGMYFIRYIKKVNVYLFIIALLVTGIMFFKPIDINFMYLITIIGFSLFIVLVFVGQLIKSERVQRPFIAISKYSFAVFLVHHVIIEQLLVSFTGKVISPVESYCLFVIVCIVIAVISKLLFTITDKLSGYVRRLKNGGETWQQHANQKL